MSCCSSAGRWTRCSTCSAARSRAGQRPARLPFSFDRPDFRTGRPPLSAGQRAAARELLAGAGLAPAALARRARPATFVDVVWRGSTFTELFALLDDWIAETGAPWDATRRKLRFVGVTQRQKTSPNAWRWQQHAGWPDRLPAAAVRNVSLDPFVWSYLGNEQPKLTRSFRPDRWVVEDPGPDRGEATRRALAQAVAVVGYGRSPQGRRALARAIAGSRPWPSRGCAPSSTSCQPVTVRLG